MARRVKALLFSQSVLLVLLIQSCGSVPVTDDGKLAEVFSTQKRDVDTEEAADGTSNTSSSATGKLKLPLYPPFAFIPWMKPYSLPLLPPYSYATDLWFPPRPPAASPSASSSPTGKRQAPATAAVSSPSKFYKEKKNEFLATLFESIINATVAPDTPEKRAVTADASSASTTPALPKIDPSIFLAKKYAFLSKLFATIYNTTIPPTTDNSSDTATVKPTIVPPDFWLPFPVAPTKAPKPTKPPKGEITANSPLSDITLADLISNPSILDTVKRSAALLPSPFEKTAAASKGKTKRSIVPDDTDSDGSTTPSVDPNLILAKKFEFLVKLFTLLNSTSSTPTAASIQPEKITTTTATPTKAPKPTKPPKATKPSKVIPTPHPVLANITLAQLIANPAFLNAIVLAGKGSPSKRTIVPDSDPTANTTTTTAKPKVDPSIFLAKKYEFLTKLFTMLNSTTPATPVGSNLTDDSSEASTTLKPTIVPPDFWSFPFPTKPPKPPKPTKAPKLTTTPSLISRLTLADLLENPSLLDLAKRSVILPADPKTAKASKTSGAFSRSVVTEEPEGAPTEATTTPKVEPTPPLSKKIIFLSKLFQKLNTTTTAPVPEETGSEEVTTTTTPKPTIVPPDFWVPFPFLLKPTKAPKPPKPPKPTKPPKGLITPQSLLSEITLSDLIANPSLLDSSKRSVPVPPTVPDSTATVPLDLYIPPQLDPLTYSELASVYLDIIFTKLNESSDLTDAKKTISPKATVVPSDLWKPEPTDASTYSSKVEAFLDLLFKSLNTTDSGKPTKKAKRSLFDLDTEQEVKPDAKRSFFDDLFNYNPSPTQGASTTASTNSDVKTRSLAFKMGTPFFMPPYVYAAKMALYLDALNSLAAASATEDTTAYTGTSKRATLSEKDKLLSDIKTLLTNLDTIRNDATSLENILNQTSLISRRAVLPKTTAATLITTTTTSNPLLDFNATALAPKDVAVALILADLGTLKNNLIDAFTEAIAAQKAITTTTLAPSKKPVKVPIWAKFKATTTTEDPLAPIQKRIDLINEVFDMLAQIQKELVTGTYANSTVTTESDTTTPEVTTPAETTTTVKPGKTTLVPPSFWIPDTSDGPVDPSFYLTKTQEFLDKLFASKSNTTDSSK